MFGILAKFGFSRKSPLDTGAPIKTGMPVQTPPERQAYYQGREAAKADMPRWRHKLEHISEQEKLGYGVTIPAHETFGGIRRDFLRQGGPGLHGYFDQLREELGGTYWIQGWWDTQRGDIGDAVRAFNKGSVYRPYIRPLLPLAEAEKRLAELRRSSDWTNEEEIYFGRLEDEIRHIKHLNPPDKPPLTLVH